MGRMEESHQNRIPCVIAVCSEIAFGILLLRPLKTSFILAGDNMGPSKLQKAEKLGVQIVSEDEFLSMIEGGTSVENNTSVSPTSAETKPTTPIQLDLFS